MNKRVLILWAVALLVLTLVACKATSTSTTAPTSAAMVTPTPTSTATFTPTNTTTPTPTPTSTLTLTDTPTLTNTPTSTPTSTPEPTPTPTPTSTATPTPTPSPTPVPSLSGRVTDAATGQGIAGATVEARPAGPLYAHDWDYSAATAFDGSYAIFGLRTGNFMVRVTASAYAREYWDNVTSFQEATVINVSAGMLTPHIDFVLTEGGSISGHVYQSDGTTPVEGAQVFIRPSKYWEDAGFWATTDAEGAYEVEGLPLGNFKVRAEAPGYARLRYYDGTEGVYGWSNAANVMVIPPATAPDIDINLHLGASISGHIYQSDGSTPIPGVYTLAESTDIFGIEGYDASSNDDGYYVIAGLPPGRYKLSIPGPVGFAGGYYDAKPDRSSADIVTVAEGEALTGKDFVLEVGGPLRGHIYDEAGEPISGAFATADVADGDWTGNGLHTGPFGSYELWLGTGDYKIYASAPGYVTEWFNNRYDKENAELVHMEAPNEVSGIDFYLAQAGSISGYVYEEDGTTPIVSANVYAFPLTGDHPGAGANTGPDGSYTIEGLPSGNYKVQATVSDHVAEYYNNAFDEASATAVTVNAPDDTPGIDFALSPVSE
jgi:hypothetical protein